MTVIDTDILIDAGRGIPEALDCLKDIQKNSAPAISVVTQMELLVGVRNKTELGALDGFPEAVPDSALGQGDFGQVGRVAASLPPQSRLAHRR